MYIKKDLCLVFCYFLLFCFGIVFSAKQIPKTKLCKISLRSNMCRKGLDSMYYLVKNPKISSKAKLIINWHVHPRLLNYSKLTCHGGCASKIKRLSTDDAINTQVVNGFNSFLIRWFNEFLRVKFGVL